MKKIIISLSVVAAVAAVVVVGTTAFFSDTETSTGNTFTAGSIDLKVDNKCHWSGGQDCPWDNVVDPVTGKTMKANWALTDLQNGVHKFFNFADIKPGDKGENTISLHVYDNDAWGKISMALTNDLDNSCTEPEDETSGEGCTVAVPEGTTAGAGELLEAMLPGFSMWLDQGSIPGFQNTDANGNPVIPVPDQTEGDNIWQDYEGQAWNLGAEKELSDVLGYAYDNSENENEDTCADLVDGDDANADGHNGYGECQGLAEDGRMVGSTTYYFGLAWELPWDTGNIVQTDSLGGDITFNVVQHRNNPTQSGL